MAARSARRSRTEGAGVDNALVELGDLVLTAKLVEIDGDQGHEAGGDYGHR